MTEDERAARAFEGKVVSSYSLARNEMLACLHYHDKEEAALLADPKIIFQYEDIYVQERHDCALTAIHGRMAAF